MDRRNFIKKSVVSATGLGLTPLMGKSFSSLYGKEAPGNKIKIGLIGCRNQGWSNLKAFLQYPGVECISMCDIDDQYLYQRASDLQELTGKRPPQLVKDWRRVIDNKDVDMVIVGTTRPLALPSARSSLRGRKDVYVEKPLANTIEERPDGVRCAQIQQNRSSRAVATKRPHWDKAAAYVQSGKLGKVRTVKVWAYQTASGPFP